MKLNLYLIKDVFKHWGSQSNISGSPDKLTVSHFLLCKSVPDQPDHQVLYVMNKTMLSLLYNLHFCGQILCIEEPDHSILQFFPNIIWLEKKCSFTDAINMLSSTFSKFDRWELSLQNAVDRHLPLKELVHRSTDFIHNPLSMLGTSYRLLFTYFPKSAQKNIRYQTYCKGLASKEHSVISDEEINILIKNQEFLNSRFYQNPSSRFRTFLPALNEEVNTLAHNIYLNNVLVGQLYMEDILQPFTDCDETYLFILAKYISKRLSLNDINNLNTPPHLDEILLHLLNHKLVPEPRIQQLMNDLNWNTNERYLCINFQTELPDENKDLLLPVILNLTNELSECVFTPFKNSIIVIFNLTKFNVSRSDLLHILSSRLKTTTMFAGVSTEYNDFRDLYYYYLQTDFSIYKGRMKHPHYRYFLFDNYHLDYLLYRYTKLLPDRVLIPEGFQRLLRYDETHHTKYLDILYTYLKNERNIAVSARELYLHRNTFLYQIQKTQEILGMDLDTEGNRLLLQITFLLLNESINV